MNLGRCDRSFLQLLTIILSAIYVDSLDVNIGVSSQVQLPLKQGSSITLKCQGSESYEYCTWSHGPNKCKFEWKRHVTLVSGEIRRTYCSNYFNGRLHFAGDYSKHECSIQLTNSRISDHGEWRCTLEEYVFANGEGDKDTATFNLTMEPLEKKGNLFYS